MTTTWGDMPGGSIGNLPAQRMAYNLSTNKGLANLRKDKINLMNINYSGFSLCTSESNYKALLRGVFDKCKGYQVIAVIENEPDNKNVISNTTPARYLNCLKWAKEVAQEYGIEVMHGGVMMPAAYRIFHDLMLTTSQQKELKAYLSSNGFFLGSPQAARNAIMELQYCHENAIKGNFHSQQDTRYLGGVIDALRVYCYDLSDNEIGFRSDDAEVVKETVEAVNGKLSYASIYNTTGVGGKARPLTAEQREALMGLM